MAVARYQTKRSALKTALTAPTTVPRGAPQSQVQTAQIQTPAAAVTLRVTAKAAADLNLVQIVKKIVCICW